MIAPVFIVTLALMLALVSAAAPLAADIKVQKSTKKAIPKGLQMMQERMFGASKMPNPVMSHMAAFHGKDAVAAAKTAASEKSLPALEEADSVNNKKMGAAKKNFKAQWTAADDDDALVADVGDILHYDFYPRDNHCHEDDLIGRMSYKSGVCVKLPYFGGSFKIQEYKYNINDQTPGAGPSFEIAYKYFSDTDCTNTVFWGKGQTENLYMSTGAAVDECKAFGYYKPDDQTSRTDEDDQFGATGDGNQNNLPSGDRQANHQRHFFGYYPTPDEAAEYLGEVLATGGTNQQFLPATPAGAFQVSTDTSIIDEIENSYTMYSLSSADACIGSNNVNEESCKEAQKQAVMAQTWANAKFDDCNYLYTAGEKNNDDDDDDGDDIPFKNIGAPIYSQVVCDEKRGPVYYEYHDAQCRKIFKHPDNSLAKGISFNEAFGVGGPFEGFFSGYRFDDDAQSVGTYYLPFNPVFTCKVAKKSFYPIMVALVVGFVVVLPATVFAFYMLNKRFGWSLGTACKRAFNAGDAEESSNEGKSVELAPVNTA